MKARFDSDGKGKGYERTIAKLLSGWVGFKLIRTPMSGAWTGSSGDIIPEGRTSAFPFTIECKNRKDWDFDQILAGKGQFYQWIEQAEAESEKDQSINGGSPIPLVIFTRNYKPDYIAIPFELKYKMKPYVPFILLEAKGKIWTIAQLKPLIQFVSFEEFLTLVP